MKRQALRAGADLGSTTAKLVVLDDSGGILFSSYRRHGSHITETLTNIFAEAEDSLGGRFMNLCFTGSAGMGIAENIEAPFIQEVVAAGEATMRRHPEAATLIDIGGEDSKMIFFSPHRPPDIRMNGSCAGGTGAFIDQMAALLDLSIEELDRLARKHERIHPIASRCGVFARTDVQNLVSRRIPLPDVCASILQAVAVQNLNALARGASLRPSILFCGGPLTFLPALRDAFTRSLGLSTEEVVLPEDGLFFPATGAALASEGKASPAPPEVWLNALQRLRSEKRQTVDRLAPLFDTVAHHRWNRRRRIVPLAQLPPESAQPPFFLGIDCGSTTTKLLVIDSRNRTVFSDYRPNRGNSLEAVKKALQGYRSAIADRDDCMPAAALATGYGEDLITAAFDLGPGIVETAAHRRAAVQCDPGVSFILDIGGQDMKAIFIGEEGIDRIEINEACSSGCGSFIEGFAQSLGLTAEEFGRLACRSSGPCDLGTRCTVFMNSRIKQAQRENASIEDIAAGLAYSVVRNSLFKVLKLRDSSELGNHIVVQGGTFRNPAILRALECITGASATASDRPEMMGAFGAALLAREAWLADPDSVRPVRIRSLDAAADGKTRDVECSGCTNRCIVTVHSFGEGRRFFSGNKCERLFSNGGRKAERGTNLFSRRNELLFGSIPSPVTPVKGLSIGIPRILGMYENIPFWSTLLSECGFRVILSGASTQEINEKGLGSVMADNICFPAKLAHGHVADLAEKKVDRLLYPLTIHERREEPDLPNSYNCPIVASYAEVLKGSLECLGRDAPAFDAPVVSFRDEGLLRKACRRYLKSLGVSGRRFSRAFTLACSTQETFRASLNAGVARCVDEARRNGRPLVVLAGRPYHADPLIEHQTSDILADLGAHVLPCEAAARLCETSIRKFRVIPQWTYPNRVLKAARWVADQPERHIQFVMLNSFGCGPDAFIMDEIRDILSSGNKPLTIIKIDEIASTGSTRLRLRSLMETIGGADSGPSSRPTVIVRTTPPYLSSDRKKTIIAPWLADCYAPFFPAVFRRAGYDLQMLPPSDGQSVEYGMKYANNEICYPAIIVIGDVIKAFKQGRHDPDHTVVGMSQTGGQCRATNYVPLIKKALVSAGYPQVPVIAAAHNKALANEQPGFAMPLHRIIRPAFTSLLYADAIARMYYKAAPRHGRRDEAESLRRRYIDAGRNCAEVDDAAGLMHHLAEAVSAFNEIMGKNGSLPKVGIVGEIFLKYNRFSQMNVVDWLMDQNIEVVIPPLTDFVMQFFVNIKEKRRHYLERGRAGTRLLEAFLEFRAMRWMQRFETILKGFRGYEPSQSIYGKAGVAKRLVSLANQFGEGWLIPAEITGFAREGIRNVVCLQPFGCIANQVVAKGIESRIQTRYPMMNLLFLDFDAGTSEVNILNRLHFMVENARAQESAFAVHHQA